MSGKRLLALGALALTGLVAGGPALAAERLPLTVDGQPLVRGGAPLPDFHLNFMLDDPGRIALATPGGGDDIEIALTTPKSGVFRFLFSPRAQFGVGYDQLTGTNRGFAGLTWNLFDDGGLFGSVGLAGSYDPGSNVPYDTQRYAFDPPLMLHGAIELGYHLGQQHSLTLRLDEGRVPDFRLNSETSDDLRLRYGLKF